MIDFEKEHLAMIEQRENVIFEIERVLFTKRYKISKKHLDIFTVQSIAMLYAIWEGYIQQTFQLYIKYINSLNIDFNDFNDNIVVFHMDNCFKQFHSYPSKNLGKINFYTKLANHFSENKHNIYSSVNTESNVSYDVMNKLLSQFGIEIFPERWERYNYPAPSLKEKMNTFLRYRNGVAHGGDIESEEKVTNEIFNDYKYLVKDLMYEIHNRFMNAIDNKSYLQH
jgi:hypothetical protein